MIDQCFIICSSGQPLFVHNPGGKDYNVLVSGFLSSLQTFAEHLELSRISKIELNNKTYFYSVHDPIISVVQASPEDEIGARVCQITADRLARAFLRKFPAEQIDNWCGELEEFATFQEIYTEVEAATTQMLQQGHRGFITKYFVEAANDENILGSVVFDLDADEIVASDIPQVFSVKDFEAFGSMLFSFTDRLGRTLQAGGINEILIRAKNYWIGGFRKGSLAIFMLFAQDYFGKVLPEFVKTTLETPITY